MFVYPNKSLLKNESLQEYINDSIQKSIEHKIKNKKTTYFVKSPIKCDLDYLNCDYKWPKEKLNINFFLINNYLNKNSLVTKDYLKNNFLVPFYFYFISTSSFFVWNYLWKK